jgi:hypothetical protein
MRAVGDLDGQLAHAFRRVLGRRPTDYDLEALRRMHARQLEFFSTDAESAQQLLAVGESQRDKTLDPAGHAALTSVRLAILNLDEALTRE